MRTLFLIALVAAPITILPALAQESGGCPNTCPEGMVVNTDTGKCEPYTPMV